MRFCSFSLICYSCFPFCNLLFVFFFFLFDFSCVFLLLCFSFSIIKRYILRPCFVRLLDFAFSPHFPIYWAVTNTIGEFFAISEFEKSTQLFVVIPNIVSNFAPVI